MKVTREQVEQAVRKHLRKPSLYQIPDSEWLEWLDDALMQGCDWLDWLQEHNPLPAAAVEELCVRHEEARRLLLLVLTQIMTLKPEMLETLAQETGYALTNTMDEIAKLLSQQEDTP